MSRLIYGGIEIGLTKTESASYVPVFAEDGTYQYTRFELTVAGLVNPQTMSYSPGYGSNPNPIRSPGNLAAYTIEAIRSALLQPRQTMIYDIAGEQMIVSPVPGFPCDAMNGPLPGPLTMTRIDGTKSIHIRFSIATFLIECPGGITPSALVSNTYAQSHGIDLQERVTISTTGQAFFRTDVMEQAGNLADDYRILIAIPCPKGCKRVGAEIIITPARNALTYRFTDVEQMFDMGDTDPREGFTGGLTGSGAKDIKVTRMVSSTGAQNAGAGSGVVSFMSIHSVTVNIVGSKLASNWVLTQLAFRIIQSILPIGNPAAGYLKQISVTQEVTDRIIGVRADMMLTPKDAGKIAVLEAQGLREDDIFPDLGGVNPPFLNRGGTAGTYTNELKASPWKAICQKVARPSEGYNDPTTGGAISNQTGPIATVTTSTVLPDFQTQYSYQTSAYAYTDYEINTSYPIDAGILMVAVAGAAGASASPPSTGGSYGSQTFTPTLPPGVTSPPAVPPSTKGTGGYVAGSNMGGAPATAPATGTTGGYSGAWPDAAFLTVARPTTRKVIDITASRVGAVPALPALDPDPNAVLLEAIPAYKAPALLPDGTSWMYFAAIRLVYGMKRSKKLGDGFGMGAVPYATGIAAESVYDGSNFLPGIADGDPSPSTADTSGAGGAGSIVAGTGGDYGTLGGYRRPINAPPIFAAPSSGGSGGTSSAPPGVAT